jgi:hypothetical protein
MGPSHHHQHPEDCEIQFEVFVLMENHIPEGTFPDTIPKFTPRDANPKYQNAHHQVASMIVPIGNGAFAISGKSMPDLLLLVLTVARETPRSRISNQSQDQKTSQRLVFFIASMELQHCQR